MPLYDFRCAACDTVAEDFRRYEHRDEPKACTCGGEMKRTFMPPQVMRDIEPYRSPIDNTMITSRSQHRDHMKRHRVIEMGNEKPKQHVRSIPKESLRAEMRSVVQRMKLEGTLRER